MPAEPHQQHSGAPARARTLHATPRAQVTARGLQWHIFDVVFATDGADATSREGKVGRREQVKRQLAARKSVVKATSQTSPETKKMSDERFAFRATSHTEPAFFGRFFLLLTVWFFCDVAGGGSRRVGQPGPRKGQAGGALHAVAYAAEVAAGALRCAEY